MIILRKGFLYKANSKILCQIQMVLSLPFVSIDFAEVEGELGGLSMSGCKKLCPVKVRINFAAAADLNSRARGCETLAPNVPYSLGISSKSN